MKIRKHLNITLIITILLSILTVILLFNKTLTIGLYTISEDHLTRVMEPLKEELLVKPLEDMEEFGNTVLSIAKEQITLEGETDLSYVEAALAEYHTIDGIQIYLDEKLLYSFVDNAIYAPLLIDINSSDTLGTWYNGTENTGLYYAGNLIQTTDMGQLQAVLISVSPIDELLEKYKLSYDVEATLFIDNMRYFTTIVQDNESLIGTELNKQVYDQVIGLGQAYIGETDIVDEKYITYYTPLSNIDEDRFGIFFIGIPVDHIYELSNQFGYKARTAIVLIGVILFASMHLFLKFSLFNPLQALSALIEKIRRNEKITDNNPIEKSSTELSVLYESIQHMYQDIKHSEKALEEIAYIDSLTGIHNRNALMANYTSSRCKEAIHSLILLNIDSVKSINRIAGPRIGDELIIVVANRLKQICEEEQLELFNVAGGEFVLVSRQRLDIDELSHLKVALLNALSIEYRLHEHTINATCSIGMAYSSKCEEGFCNSPQGFEELYKNAEYALMLAKDDGKNTGVIFDNSLSKYKVRINEIEVALSSALEHNELYLSYQPKLDLKSNRCIGFESLIRWAHPTLGNIPPDVFIPIAEMNGEIQKIGDFVIRESLKFINKINVNKNANHIISINVSPLQIMSDTFVEEFLEWIRKSKVNPEWVELEITESTLMESLKEVSERISKIRRMGVNIALDDFGTGYSSLTYLSKLPIDILKIDKSFVDIISIDVSRSLVQDIIKIGKKMNLKIIAEGVENREQLSYLIDHGCDEIQGYYYSKPLVEEDALKLIEEVDVKVGVNQTN